jgi:hypothetical protein
VLAEHRIVPLRAEEQIRECVAAALMATQAICEANGVISPEGTPQHKLQQEIARTFAPKRMVLPLFGTGRGGQSPAVVGPTVLEAIVDFFLGPLFDEKHMLVTDIHLSVYSEDDVDTMVNALAKTEVAQA